jgi:hypothetical protein
MSDVEEQVQEYTIVRFQGIRVEYDQIQWTHFWPDILVEPTVPNHIVPECALQTRLEEKFPERKFRVFMSHVIYEEEECSMYFIGFDDEIEEVELKCSPYTATLALETGVDEKRNELELAHEQDDVLYSIYTYMKHITDEFDTSFEIREFTIIVPS